MTQSEVIRRVEEIRSAADSGRLLSARAMEVRLHRDVLAAIRDQDYRGSRTPEMGLAYEALRTELIETLEPMR